VTKRGAAFEWARCRKYPPTAVRYVEGERDEVGTFTWMLDLIREGDAWRVGRSLTVNTNSSREQEVVAELRGMRFDSTRQLAAELVPLVDELLELPAPE